MSEDGQYVVCNFCTQNAVPPGPGFFGISDINCLERPETIQSEQFRNLKKRLIKHVTTRGHIKKKKKMKAKQ